MINLLVKIYNYIRIFFLLFKDLLKKKKKKKECPEKTILSDF